MKRCLGEVEIVLKVTEIVEYFLPGPEFAGGFLPSVKVIGHRP